MAVIFATGGETEDEPGLLYWSHKLGWSPDRDSATAFPDGTPPLFISDQPVITIDVTPLAANVDWASLPLAVRPIGF